MSENTIPALINTLRNARRLFVPDWNARIAEVHELANARAVRTISNLQAAALEMKNPTLSQAAVKAIGQIGTQAGYQALAHILSIVPPGPLRQESLNALASSGEEDAVYLLIATWANAGAEIAADIHESWSKIEAGI